MAEKTIGRGEYAAEDNNDSNSIRGTFVENDADAPFVHPGASSTDPVLNVDRTVIRVQGEEWDIASGTVTLAPNATAYPRRDLVLARKGPTPSDPGSFDVLTGEPIDSETWATLTYDDPNDDDTPLIDGDTGVPVHPAANLADIQPPPATGLRNEGPVLAMVYCPPGMADSTDITDDYITDLTAEGVSFADVLRSGEAIEEIEAHPDTLDAAAASAERLAFQESASETPMSVAGQDLNANGGSETEYVFISGAETLYLRRMGVIEHSTQDAFQGVAAEMGIIAADGTFNAQLTDNDRARRLSTSETVIINGSATVYFRVRNDSTTDAVDANAVFSFQIYNYDRAAEGLQ